MLSKSELNKFGTSMTYYSNPYFDEVILFWQLEVFTSQDKYKPFTCNECERKELYIGESKKNKADFIAKIQKELLKQKNQEWPFGERLSIQYSISDTQSKINLVDLDNLAKSILDSLNGVVYKDDRQAVGLSGIKYVVRGLKGVFVAIKRLEKDEYPIFQKSFFCGGEDVWSKERKLLLEQGSMGRFIKVDFSF
jgi:Holliday junction resolvase RusA-like endonuclease